MSRPVKIVTAYDPPPIPMRNCDWSAVTDNYEPGHPIGWGRTEAEATSDLLERICCHCGGKLDQYDWCAARCEGSREP